jgi:hypothetical protein
LIGNAAPAQHVNAPAFCDAAHTTPGARFRRLSAEQFEGRAHGMGLLRNLKLRNRAYVCAYNSFRFAARLRGDLSEFAPSIAETIQSVGDELASLARDACPSETDRRQLIDGLEGALRALGLSDAAQVHIVSQLAPRIMAGEPASVSKEAWTRMAV